MQEMTSLDKFVVNVLSRRGWVMYWSRLKVLEEAKTIVWVGKRKRVFYTCAICKGNSFSAKEVEVDHIEPRIDPEKGWEGIQIWILRTFCEPEKLRVLCKECHHKISAEQNEVRRAKKP